MIKGFLNADAEAVFHGRRPRRLPFGIMVAAQRKLSYLHAARSLQDLLVPPGNRLEKLKGTRVERYSIRVNDQWRICFAWQAGDAYDVEIVDYH